MAVEVGVRLGLGELNFRLREIQSRIERTDAWSRLHFL